MTAAQAVIAAARLGCNCLDHLPPRVLESMAVWRSTSRKTTQECRQHGTHLGKPPCKMAHESIREGQSRRVTGRIDECPHEHEGGHRQQRIGTGGAHDLLDEDLVVAGLQKEEAQGADGDRERYWER